LKALLSSAVWIERGGVRVLSIRAGEGAPNAARPSRSIGGGHRHRSFVLGAGGHGADPGTDISTTAGLNRLLLVKPDSGRYTHHFLTGLSFDSIGPLDFDISFVWDRVQEPRPESSGAIPKKDDYRLILGLKFDF
jgi:hypothetical protein